MDKQALSHLIGQAQDRTSTLLQNLTWGNKAYIDKVSLVANEGERLNAFSENQVFAGSQTVLDNKE